MSTLALATLAILGIRQDLPVLTLRTDDTPITHSCRIEIPPDTVIVDANGDGVLHVAASDVTIEFAPSAALRGAPADAPPDKYEGYAIRVQGQRNVIIRGGRISGYRCAVWASSADGLTIEDLDASDNRRQRLRSTPAREDSGDWMYPHDNDANQWLTNYAAALYVEDSSGVVLRRCRVRHGQSALCLDRVTDGRVYDNDFSFNSAWGIALWRSSRNVVSRNACDFCIRGYSHGVYNRGQDSAGILMFEQCCDNVIAENSVTHGGDGFFGFAGREANGERAAADGGAATQPAIARRGCDRNLLVRNDFSYAAAHGIEMTFSFGNRYIANRLVDNSICGIWNGYSQDTLIAGNEIAENGERGYGLERGGVNIDSSRTNRIVGNQFRGNRCGVHLWWAARDQFPPWAVAHCPDWDGNVIADNTFAGDRLIWHFRGPGKVALVRNVVRDAEKIEDIDPLAQVLRDDALPVEAAEIPTYPLFGETRPVGARPNLRGRQQIVMTEWGPWDHASPFVREIENSGARRMYRITGVSEPPSFTVQGADVEAEPVGADPTADPPAYNFAIATRSPGVHPFELTIRAGAYHQALRGVLVATTWELREFPWTHDPLTDLAGWRADAQTATAKTRRLDALQLSRTPSSLGVQADGAPDTPTSAPASESGDRRAARRRTPLGIIARTRLRFPAGEWSLSLASAGGARLLADGQPLIEAWERHRGVQSHEALLTVQTPREVELTIEQFRERQWTTLALEIDASPAPERTADHDGD